MLRRTKFLIFSFFVALNLIAANMVLAFQPLNNVEGGFDQNSAFLDASGFTAADDNSLSSIIASVIKAFLGLMGVIFIVYLVYAGYNYMTAAGDNQKVEKAITTIQRSIIGLIIVVSAYAITAYVFKNLPSSAGGGGTTTMQ